MSDRRQQLVDVVVVGAGLAGLNVARRLVSCGYRVKLLEARERVGGRLHSITRQDRHFDVGGQWLGAGQHRVRKLADELGLERFPQHHQGDKVMRLDGAVSRYAGTLPNVGWFDLLQIELALRRVDRMASRLHLEAPHQAPQAAAWDRLSLADARRRWLRSEPARQLFDIATRVVFGAEPAELSLLYFLFYVNAAGGFRRMLEVDGGAQQERFVRGAQALAEGLAKRLPADCLQLGAAVEAVEQHADALEVHTTRGSFRARYLTMAIPPQLAARITFSPELPPARRQVLQRWQMGATTKVLAFYERASWRQDGLSGEAICSDGPFTTVFDNSSADGAVACLLGFIVGRRARTWAKRPAHERRAEALATFEALLGAPPAECRDYLEQDWAAEAWSGGCPTASMAAGDLTTYGDVWRAPVGRIHWAGTETSRHWNGYMEGALESAERAASSVLEQLCEEGEP